MLDNPRIWLVVSHWTGHSRRNLRRLLSQMNKVSAGAIYDLVIVCNGGGLDLEGLRKVSPAGFVTVINRENQGYNIGAWDAGFRAFPDYDYYLFLQDECVLRNFGWLDAFVFRIQNDPGVGLLGEALMWDGISWEFAKVATARDLGEDWYAPSEVNPIDFYQAQLADMGLPASSVGTHRQALVLFIDSALMRKTDGFQNDSRYEYAVACEIAISRRIAALGYRIGLVSPGKPFAMIGHPQWGPLGLAFVGMRRRVRQAIRKLHGWARISSAI